MNRKRTKIVATISDKRCEPEFIRELFEAGMDAIRINSAHLNAEGALKIIENGRKVSDRIPFILDTKGPEIRTTKSDSPIKVERGQKIKIMGDPDAITTQACIFVNYPGFTDDVPVGSSILIDDGEVELVIESKDGNILECVATNDGCIGSRKSLNVPGVRFALPSVSERDREFIEFAAAEDIAFIAHSFVRSARDVIDVQSVLDEFGGKAKIIAKIENQEGVDNIDEILDNVYGIMVARGDLAIEIPYEKIPGIQRMIITKCIERRKPVIVATQMLH
ncbi:MAG: pyruvate kinase, partial [Bacteroidetes bacterium]|nr:pyruvate kinase [Bacteroidota bacterium]